MDFAIRLGISTYEWNKAPGVKCMAAFTTHKREEVSVEELRAHAIMQAHSSHSS